MHKVVTGAAGFIRFHLTKALLGRGKKVTGIDNLNDYYDPILKGDCLLELRSYPEFNLKSYHEAW